MWRTESSTKVVSDFLGLADFPVGQADFSSHLPDGLAWLNVFTVLIELWASCPKAELRL